MSKIITDTIQKIVKRPMSEGGFNFRQHAETSADIVLFDTGEVDENGNKIYSNVQEEIEKIGENIEITGDLITIDDIDAICGASIEGVTASEVEF